MALGFFLGSVFPPQYLPWKGSPGPQPAKVQAAAAADGSVSLPSGSSSAGTGAQGTEERRTLNKNDNIPLLESAETVLQLLQRRDYQALSTWVDPQRGVTITAFSTVDGEVDLNFSAGQVAQFGQDAQRYHWGTVPGSGEEIQMTPAEFVSAYLCAADYTQAAWIGVDRVNITGNALENVAEAYPGCRFVDLTFPGSQTAGQNGVQGTDWSSLKLVFAPGEVGWTLVGLVHSQWTP